MSPQAVRPPARPRAAARGVSLIEVLVVVVLFAFGLLGLVGLQARAQQVSVGAEDSQRAALLAQELATTMLSKGTVNLPTADVTTWQTLVANSAGRGLPSGTGTVDVTGNVARITVSWTPPQAASGAAPSRYMTEVLVP